MSRQQILLIVAILGLCSYVGMQLIGPIKNRIVSNEQTIIALNENIKWADQQLAQKEQLKRQMNDLQLRHELLDRKIPHGTGNAEMLLLLSSWARANNVQTWRVSERWSGQESNGEQSEEARLAYNTFFWQGFGNYSDFKNFLQALERCDRLLEIGEVKLVKSKSTLEDTDEEQEISEELLSVSFQVKTYYDLGGFGPEGPGLFPAIVEETQGTANPF